MQIRKTVSPSEADLEELNREFWRHVSTKMPTLANESEDKKFLLSIHDKAIFVGGISGNVYWDGLEIDTLWVAETYRGWGIGRKLLEQAEKYAIDNGAVISFLKTVDATEFYHKSGYQIYGQLEDRPIGTVLYHMKKRLAASINHSNASNRTRAVK